MANPNKAPRPSKYYEGLSVKGFGEPVIYVDESDAPESITKGNKSLHVAQKRSGKTLRYVITRIRKIGSHNYYFGKRVKDSKGMKHPVRFGEEKMVITDNSLKFPRSYQAYWYAYE